MHISIKRKVFRSGLLALAGLSLMAACSRDTNVEKVAYPGGFYDARLSAARETPREFTIAVSPVSPGVEGALEAGRYEATKYCLRTFGSSKVDWVAGPDMPADEVTVVENSLTLSGTCRR